jgi:hypothetical protein
MSSKGARPDFMDYMVVVTTPQRTQVAMIPSKSIIIFRIWTIRCLIAKDDLNEVEIESRFHFDKYLDYLYDGSLQDRTNLHLQILDKKGRCRKASQQCCIVFSDCPGRGSFQKVGDHCASQVAPNRWLPVNQKHSIQLNNQESQGLLTSVDRENEEHHKWTCPPTSHSLVEP